MKRLGSSTADHRANARDTFKHVAHAVRQTEKAAKAGHCFQAFVALSFALEYGAAMRAEQRGTGRMSDRGRLASGRAAKTFNKFCKVVKK